MEGILEFSRLLSPAQLKRLAATRVEMERIYRLSDRWLAEELLRLARRAREEHPDKLACPDVMTYEASFVWDLVPEVAKRLGASTFRREEARDWQMRDADVVELREIAGVFLLNSSLGRWIDHKAEKPSAVELLGHEVANGNPVAMALDRMCQAPARGNDRDDYVARQVREVSRRRGFEETAEWSPVLQNWEKERER